MILSFYKSAESSYIGIHYIEIMNKAAESNQLFDNYLLTQEPQFRPCLTALHTLVKAIVPGAKETFSYQVHCFKHIYMLVGIGSNKQYCSLYTMSSKLVKQMADELKGYKISGMTLHFEPDKPLPAAIITRIVLERVKENELLASSRKKMKCHGFK